MRTISLDATSLEPCVQLRLEYKIDLFIDKNSDQLFQRFMETYACIG